ncbi:hypothetical protein ZWY2020_044955 [Hordeum vulgare]|nr:hypothetical protein ZWY2020_044955 [Hordeum vulgare]
MPPSSPAGDALLSWKKMRPYPASGGHGCRSLRPCRALGSLAEPMEVAGEADGGSVAFLLRLLRVGADAALLAECIVCCLHRSSSSSESPTSLEPWIGACFSYLIS